MSERAASITLPNGEVVCDLNGMWIAEYMLPSGRISDDVVSIKQEGDLFVGRKTVGDQYVGAGKETIKGVLKNEGFSEALAYHAYDGWTPMKTTLYSDCSGFVLKHYTGAILTFDRQTDSVANKDRRTNSNISSNSEVPSIKPNIRMLETSLKENGKPVRLTAVVWRPEGKGPFPLLVFNHGSTGRGTDPDLIRKTWWYEQIGLFFVERGWMVAIPYRRGRGKSDGVYDEGFSQSRSDGYSCKPERSLPGFERALTDIVAAMEVLLRNSDIDRDRVVVGGASRGGVLAAVYAAEHPSEVQGVINFVGGWLGKGCGTVGAVNSRLFERAARYPRRTLWLYAHDDPYFEVSHTRGYFVEFTSAGGKGFFYSFKVPNGSGHDLMIWPEVWERQVEGYLESLPPIRMNRHAVSPGRQSQDKS